MLTCKKILSLLVISKNYLQNHCTFWSKSPSVGWAFWKRFLFYWNYCQEESIIWYFFCPSLETSFLWQIRIIAYSHPNKRGVGRRKVRRRLSVFFFFFSQRSCLSEKKRTVRTGGGHGIVHSSLPLSTHVQ